MSNVLWRMATVWIAVGFCEAAAQAEEALQVVSWNAEANFNGADPTVIAERMASFEGVDVWGFCEVKDSNWANELEHGAELGENAEFTHVLGSSIIYTANTR